MSIKALLTRILEVFHAPIIVRSYSLTNQSATTWYKPFTINVAVDGYTAIGYKSITMNQATMHTYWFHFDNNNTVANLGIAKASETGTISNLNVTIYIVYVKNELLG